MRTDAKHGRDWLIFASLAFHLRVSPHGNQPQFAPVSTPSNQSHVVQSGEYEYCLHWKRLWIRTDGDTATALRRQEGIKSEGHVRIRKDAFPGPDERRRIVEEAQRAGMHARRLMECLLLLEHDANRLFKLEYVEDGGGGSGADLTRYLAAPTEPRVIAQRELRG